MSFFENDQRLWAAATAKTEWLAAADALEKHQDKIKTLRESRISAAGPKLTGMPKASSSGDALADYMVRLVELEDKEKDLLDIVRKKYIAFVVAEYQTIKLINLSDDPELLGLRYLMGYSYRKLAEIYDMSETKMRAKLKRIVEGIKDEDSSDND